MSEMRVSYVIPVRDCERYLGEAIESILRQTYPVTEILVVDDGSTDGSVRVAESFGGPVRCVSQDPTGQSAARNRGVELTGGDLVGFLDADDLVHPKKIEKQVARFLAEPDLVFCDGYARNFWSPEIPECERTNTSLQTITHSVDEPFPDHISTWLVRRTLFESLGGFIVGMMFSEDQEWRDRVRDEGSPTETLKEVLSRRRLHGRSLTRSHFDKHVDGIVEYKKSRMDRRGRIVGRDPK